MCLASIFLINLYSVFILYKINFILMFIVESKNYLM